MKANREAAVVGAFVADALSLGVHWVYNTGAIDKKIGRVERFYDPMTSYHQGKKAGDFTHYGDQMLVLLQSLNDHGGFDALAFARSWRGFFADYGGYFDKATTATLENMDAGGDLTRCASSSDDLAGASRMAPLVTFHAGSAEDLIRTARRQTAITHDDQRVVLSAEFFARTVFEVLGGQSPVDAMHAALNAGIADSPIAPLIEKGLNRRDRDTREAIAEFGQMCSIEAGLPGVVHLVARYAEDYRSAMIENVMAGGDSSARGMVAGMILGAAHGMAAIPAQWRSEMNAAGRIAALLDRS